MFGVLVSCGMAGKQVANLGGQQVKGSIVRQANKLLNKQGRWIGPLCGVHVFGTWTMFASLVNPLHYWVFKSIQS